jgi:hypothetical protein
LVVDSAEATPFLVRFPHDGISTSPTHQKKERKKTKDKFGRSTQTATEIVLLTNEVKRYKINSTYYKVAIVLPRATNILSEEHLYVRPSISG